MDFAPSVYEHAARLIDRTAWEVSRDGELMFQAHAAAYELYGHRPVVVGIDIYNLEAEAYGAEVARASGTGIPAIVKPLVHSAAELERLALFDPRSAGRIPMVIGVAARLAERFPEADVRVPLSGPFSIAGNLLGVEALLCEVAVEPERVRTALARLAEGQVNFAHAVNAAGLDVAFFESAAAPPLLGPEQFRRIELPVLKDLLDCLASVLGHPVPCIIGGNTAPIVEAILETGTRYIICPSETDQPTFMQKVWDRHEVRVRVNMSSEVIARGTEEQIRAEVDRIVDLTRGRPNVCVGTGALPYETPPESVLFAKRYCEPL